MKQVLPYCIILEHENTPTHVLTDIKISICNSNIIHYYADLKNNMWGNYIYLLQITSPGKNLLMVWVGLTEFYSPAKLANSWITPRSLLFGVLAHLCHWHPLSQFFLSATIIVCLEVISSQQYIYALNFSTQCLISGCLEEAQRMVQALFHGKHWEVSTICIRIAPTSVFYSE